MSRIKYDFKGLEELRKDLKRAGSKGEQALNKKCNELVDYIVGKAKSRIHNKSGTLSSKTVARKEGKGKVVAVEKFYASFVEYGTKRMKNQEQSEKVHKFVRPALSAGYKKLDKDLKDVANEIENSI